MTSLNQYSLLDQRKENWVLPKENPQQSLTIEKSIKLGEDSTSTLSLVIQRVRFKKNLQKEYISIQGGVKARKPSILMIPEFHSVFLFS
jgi:hypothetical protein